MFYYHLLFQLTNKINSFIEKQITAIITLYTSQANECAYRACRARRDVPCRACCTECATQHVQLFPVPKCMGRYRVVTCRGVTQQVEFNKDKIVVYVRTCLFVSEGCTATSREAPEIAYRVPAAGTVTSPHVTGAPTSPCAVFLQWPRRWPPSVCPVNYSHGLLFISRFLYRIDDDLNNRAVFSRKRYVPECLSIWPSIRAWGMAAFAWKFWVGHS